MSKAAPSTDEVREHLKALMAAHGVALSDYKDWLVTGEELPAMRGNWIHQIGNQEIGRLDIHVLPDRDRVINESFAGVGSDGERYGDALQNFQLGSLHVLLSALWAQPHDSVVVQDWQFPSGRWTVHIGEFVSRCLGPDEVDFPPDLLDVIKNALLRADLTPEVHWLRTFYCKPGGGDTVVEVLLDNAEWAEGEQAVSQAHWPASDYYYSLRNFLILVPQV
ncbi:DUF6348 family protein [Nitratireductor sp. XY-223]|uniref:DUF6348 family protein n=1 Tax=Nitratireductor sp. XY-223 TaxID=2561926 RepID=UPI0010AA2414|nr:DUF6348 family protein [Nitratireductor sp. XY-223]